MQLVDSSLEASERVPLASKRAALISHQLTRDACALVTRTTFGRDRAIWLLRLALQLAGRAEGGLSVDAASALLLASPDEACARAAALASPERLRALPEPERPPPWLPERSWRLASALALVSVGLTTLPGSLASNEAQWRKWIDSDTPESDHIPDLHDRTTPLERCARARGSRARARPPICRALASAAPSGPPFARAHHRRRRREPPVSRSAARARSSPSALHAARACADARAQAAPRALPARGPAAAGSDSVLR